jgi:hypothetical protein
MEGLMRQIRHTLEDKALDWFDKKATILTTYTTRGDEGEVTNHTIPRAQAIEHPDCDRWQEYLILRYQFIRHYNVPKGVEKFKRYWSNPPAMPEEATQQSIEDWSMRWDEGNGYYEYLQPPDEASLTISQREKHAIMARKIPSKAKGYFGKGDYSVDIYEVEEEEIIEKIVAAADKADQDLVNAEKYLAKVRAEQDSEAQTNEEQRSKKRTHEQQLKTGFHRTVPCKFCGRMHGAPDEKCWQNPNNTNQKPEYQKPKRPRNDKEANLQKEINALRKEINTLKQIKNATRKHDDKEKEQEYGSDEPENSELSKDLEYP